MFLRELTPAECTAVLSAARVGRLGCVHDDRPYVVPIYFAFADHHLYSFSMEGRKVAWMRQNPQVCLQVDTMHDGREWRSVVAYGCYEELPDDARWHLERKKAWQLLQRQANWWEPGVLYPVQRTNGDQAGYLYYRIRIESLTGREAVDESEAAG